jgi:hypothetical protein
MMRKTLNLADALKLHNKLFFIILDGFEINHNFVFLLGKGIREQLSPGKWKIRITTLNES